MKDHYPKEGQKYNLFLKAFFEIEKISPKIYRDSELYTIKIYHSTGHGGGLTLPNAFIETYCGTTKSLNLKFSRKNHDRFIYIYLSQKPILVYGEWLDISPYGFLENDLFEI